MSFELTPRTIAVDAGTAAYLFPLLTREYGEYLPTGDGTIAIKTIGAFWDNTEHTRWRAADIGRGTIVGSKLTDGRVAFTCLWQADLAANFDLGQIPGNIEQLSYDQLQALLPGVDEDINFS
jgi:hypothetical protein